MTEPLHSIIRPYVGGSISDADDLCNEFTGWLQRNFDNYKDKPLIGKICNEIWKSCEDSDKCK